MEIEPLFNQIDSLAGHFGRVSGDLQAIAARGRASDYRGVMQNTRLVLEAILRDLVTRELKQTVGKAMLDELITKFRQQANAGIIPTNILAHMGTVQAWGNLSAHDHAGSLADEGVQVGKQEVIASLNSMVAILTWYAGKLGVQLGGPAPSSAVTVKTGPHPVPTPVAAPPPKSRAPVFFGGVVLLGVAGAAAWFVTRPPAVAPAAASFDALDALYRTRNEPVPPGSCRNLDEAAKLVAAKDEAALAGLTSAEAAYVLARLKHEGGTKPGAELDKASSCAGFAAALSLHGKVQVREAEAAAKGGDADAAAALYGKAARNFDAALAAAPAYKAARFNRALVLLKQNQVDDGVKDLSELVAGDPTFGEAHFYLGVAYEALARGGDEGLKKKAKDAFCAASKNGVAAAKNRCEAP
ncbi:MAG: DUF4145 domain-containing protein [Myxococcaceae bacterium]|nr:DUF4145 domain-containing protein [Myxococcaceae bacterium]